MYLNLGGEIVMTKNRSKWLLIGRFESGLGKIEIFRHGNSYTVSVNDTATQIGKRSLKVLIKDLLGDFGEIEDIDFKSFWKNPSKYFKAH